MSSYFRTVKHPITGVTEEAFFIDDYFGPHEYGVKFSDGKVFMIEDLNKNHAPKKKILTEKVPKRNVPK